MGRSQENRAIGPDAKSWAARYGESHSLRRIRRFPEGIEPPKKVRVYARQLHFILQTWDPALKKTVSLRVDGDFLTALMKAREIEQKLAETNRSHLGRQKITCAALISAYQADLARRANAGEISPATQRRYASALRHFADFAAESPGRVALDKAAAADRVFQQEFSAYLQKTRLTANGTATIRKKPLSDASFVLDVVRSMYEWGADPHRGALLPADFRNPFKQRGAQRSRIQPDQFGEPDVTLQMAVDFLRRCDAFQLPLFALITTCGLRAAEPAAIFREQLADGWIRVSCLPELELLTKGRRDKRFPLLEPLTSLLASDQQAQGLLFTRRDALRSGPCPSLGASLADLVSQFQTRCAAEQAETAAQREMIRNQIFKAAGALRYDQIEAEFQAVARSLAWPPEATLKDFRHLFSTALENAGMPEYYRRYLMGHSPGRHALATYTHLNQLKQKYSEAAGGQLAPLFEAITTRAHELGLLTDSNG